MNEQLKKALTGVGILADSMTMDEFQELKKFYSPLMEGFRGGKYIDKYYGLDTSGKTGLFYLIDFHTTYTFKEFKERYMVDKKDLISVFKQWQKVKNTIDYLKIHKHCVSLTDYATDNCIIYFNNENEVIEYFESQMKPTYDEAVEWLRDNADYWSEEKKYYIYYEDEYGYVVWDNPAIDCYKCYFTKAEKDFFFKTFGEVKKDC